MSDSMRSPVIPRSSAKKQSVMSMLFDGKSRKEIRKETGASAEHIREVDSRTFPKVDNEHKRKMEIWARCVEGARKALHQKANSTGKELK